MEMFYSLFVFQILTTTGFFNKKNYGCLQKFKNVETTKQIFCNKINTTCTMKVTFKKLGKKKKLRL